MDSYMGVQGASAAQADYDETGREFINRLPSTANPVQAYQEYLANKVEGSHDKYATSFMKASGSLAQKDITRFQNARQKMVIEQATTAARNVLTNSWDQQTKRPTGRLRP